MYDFHTHTILSDGELLPTELLRRLKVIGYSAVAITDHVDRSNIADTLAAIERVRPSAEEMGIRLLTGVEITHVPPAEIRELADFAKRNGADIVVVHGESPVEPVAPGTNHAACSSPGVDILAHPGLISKEDAILAVKNDIALEITARGGHNRTNGYVAKIAEESECLLVIDSDAHHPSDLMSDIARKVIAKGAGIKPEIVNELLSIKTNRFYARFT